MRITDMHDGFTKEGLTAEGRAKVDEIAQRHGVGADAVLVLLAALDRGGGTQAQFSHPDLGGLGQWSHRGMIMVGDMFNNALKAKVDQLCIETAGLLGDRALFVPEKVSASWSSRSSWWPADWGRPSSSGSQNDMGYACFPERRRLAIRRDGRVKLYDTGEHRIHGVSQQQSGSQDLRFTSQFGTIALHELSSVDDDLAPVDSGPSADHRPPADRVSPVDPHRAEPAARSAGHPSVDHGHREEPTPPPQARSIAATPDDDVFAKIERLHALHQKGILGEAEFAKKKEELLARI